MNLHIIVVTVVIIILYVILYIRQQNQTQIEGMTNDIKSELTPDLLYNHLCYVSDLLKTYQIKHWLMYGTLLGSVRDDNIIRYDYDIDFGASVEDADKIQSLNNTVKKDGYQFEKAYSFINKVKIWRVSFKIVYKGVEVGDVYLYQKFNDGFMRRFDVKDKVYFWPKSTYPAFFTDKLDIGTVRGRPFPVPNNSVMLLKHWYGKTWRVPIKAKAQGGEGDPDSDYFGGAKEAPLSNLINNISEIDINLKLKPVLTVKPLYVFPPEQQSWIKENENIV